MRVCRYEPAVCFACRRVACHRDRRARNPAPLGHRVRPLYRRDQSHLHPGRLGHLSRAAWLLAARHRPLRDLLSSRQVSRRGANRNFRRSDGAAAQPGHLRAAGGGGRTALSRAHTRDDRRQLRHSGRGVCLPWRRGQRAPLDAGRALRRQEAGRALQPSLQPHVRHHAGDADGGPGGWWLPARLRTGAAVCLYQPGLSAGDHPIAGAARATHPQGHRPHPLAHLARESARWGAIPCCWGCCCSPG